MALCLSVCTSVCHQPVLYRNVGTNRAHFWRRCYTWLILHCVSDGGRSPVYETFVYNTSRRSDLSAAAETCQNSFTVKLRAKRAVAQQSVIYLAHL